MLEKKHKKAISILENELLLLFTQRNMINQKNSEEKRLNEINKEILSIEKSILFLEKDK